VGSVSVWKSVTGRRVLTNLSPYAMKTMHMLAYVEKTMKLFSKQHMLALTSSGNESIKRKIPN